MTTTTHSDVTEADPSEPDRWAYLGGRMPVRWVCPTCGFSNPQDNDECWGCDAPNPSLWRCSNGHLNSDQYQRCCVCDATVYDDDPDYSDDEVRRA